MDTDTTDRGQGTTALVGGPPGPLGRWLAPSRPRRGAAVLLLLGALTYLPAWYVWLRLLGTDRAGESAVALGLLLPLGVAVGLLALAALVLTGSGAARALGGLVAATATLALLGPLVQTAPLGSDLLVPGLAPVWPTVVLLVGAVVAVALPTRHATRD